jgi:UDP-glucose 4-epimerase
MSSKSALVTGCAGFIGSHLSDRLLGLGYDVTGIDCFTDYYPRSVKEGNLSWAMDQDKFRFVEADLLKMDGFPEVDFVFHQGAQAGVRASWGGSFEIYTQNNILATQRLLEFYKDIKIEKFVYASSSSVYGDAVLPMREDSLLKPVSPYGVSKLAGEHLCYLYYKNFGVPTASLRYFTVYGPRQRPDMAIHMFVKAILGGKEISVFGDGSQTRDFTFIDDVVDANLLAAESDSAGDIFNIGGGSRISVNDLIKSIEGVLEKKAQIRFVEKQKGDVRDTWADVSRAKELLDWEPKVGIEDGVKRFVEWFHS